MGCRYGSSRPHHDIPLMVDLYKSRAAHARRAGARLPARSTASERWSTKCTPAAWHAACSPSTSTRAMPTQPAVRASIVKGVLLAGGPARACTRLTRITNKHLLPIYDRPMIAWSIEALVSSGIDEIMLVTGGTHAGEFLRLLGNGRDVRRRPAVATPTRSRPGGIAEALGLAEHFADGGPVLRHAGRQRHRAVDPAHGRRLPRRPGRRPHPADRGRRAASTCATSACRLRRRTAG